jgi:hypothetical protein
MQANAAMMGQVLSSPENRAQLQALSARVEAARVKVEAELAAWSVDKKKEFVRGFPEMTAVAQVCLQMRCEIASTSA